MSSSHATGNVQPGIDLEEHVPTANAKRTVVLGQHTDGTYVAVTVFDLANSNPQGVAIVSGSTGSPITVGRNPGRLAGPDVLATTYTTLYTATAATIANIRFYNTGSSTRTITISIKNVSGDAEGVVEVFQLASGESADINEINLSSGNLIRVKQDVGTDIEYFIHGESIS